MPDMLVKLYKVKEDPALEARLAANGIQLKRALAPDIQRITGFVAAHSGMTEKRYTELMLRTGELVMDVGTVLDGEKAVQAGLIDHLGGLSEAISCLYRMIEKKEKGAKSAVRPKKGGSRR